MVLRSEPDWVSLFKSIGIPDDESKNYAKIFMDNQITEHSAAALDKTTLNTLGITVLGDILAIVNHVTKPHSLSVDTSSRSQQTKPKSFKLLSISSDTTHPQFHKFRVDWDIYKSISSLSPEQYNAHLYNAWDETVQASLVNTKPKFLELTEEQLFKTIENIVTKRINPAVHCMNFGALQQFEHETIKDFEVCLSSASIDCEFTCPNCHYDLSEIHIKDQFIWGLFNDNKV